ncbi:MULTISPECIES: hypothetical protein [Bacillus]|uniref:hypothetical protein n=1 Tax=Bacillus TaxID=1386 RepID=UPI0002F1D981|nr:MULTISPECIES: hypothetical protein [Bacillus]
MKKISRILILFFSISIILLGCSKEKENLKKDLNLEKAQKIEVLSVDNQKSVLNVITSKTDINEFVHSLQMDKWRIKDIPLNVTREKIYKMYQEDTTKLGESSTDKKELKQIATIITYKDSPYITFKIKKLNLSFKVPKDVEEYLSSNN